MSEPFIFINTYGIKEGMTEVFREQAQAVVDLVEAEEPQMLFFGFFINDEGTEATTLQVHPDPDSMLFHMEIAREHIEESIDFLDYSNMAVGVYGTPTEPVMEMMRQLSGTGVPIAIKTPWATVNRLQSVKA